MSAKEATARIKINALLEAAGWRFFARDGAPANIVLEPGVSIHSTQLDALGNDFEQAGRGFVDFLLLDARGFPLLVLEAKAEDKNPLIGKEQARRYARSQHCRFVILSNGNLHYFWDLERGKPEDATAIPAIKTYFKAYLTSDRVRDIIESKHYTDLATNPYFSSRDFKAVPAKYRTLIPDYVKDYVSLILADAAPLGTCWFWVFAICGRPVDAGLVEWCGG